MEADSTSRKMLRIIDFIEDHDGPVTAEQLLSELGFTRSTLYRHLKILTHSGFLSSISSLGFTLGPRIVELDYKIRLRDPLLAAAKSLMQTLAEQEKGVALLCRRYQDRVLCIHQERGDTEIESNYERGLARSLYLGATSRVILANLRPGTIDRLHRTHPEEFEAAGLGNSIAEARKSLRRIRRQGWDVTEGQVTRGVTGFAAPVFDDLGEVIGSLSITLPAVDRKLRETRRLGELVRSTTDQLQQQITPKSPQ